MPRLSGDDRIEHPVTRLPRLEGCHLDPQAAGSREVGHSRIGFDAEHRAPFVCAVNRT